MKNGIGNKPRFLRLESFPTTFAAMLQIKLCLLLLSFSTIFAAPTGIANQMVKNSAHLVKRVGETRNNLHEVLFNIDKWPGIAKTNCYAMLCIFNGERIQ